MAEDLIEHYDLIVVGSGGGSKLIRPAAAMGHRVAVIERAELGGTCLNHGCIPSKMLIHAADVASSIQGASRFDLYPELSFPVQFSQLVSRVNRTIDRESHSIEPLYKNDPQITLYTGHASFVAPRVLEVGGKRLSADKIALAVGASAHIPQGIRGLQGTPFMTYKQALRRTDIPRKLVVIGGGYIAAELGYFFGALGTEVHFMVRSRMLRKEDAEIQREFQRVFCEKFPVHIGAVPSEVTHQEGIFTIAYNDKEGRSQSIESDALLVATGVEPCTRDLGVQEGGISCDSKGYIQVDECLRTSMEGVWAFGDCIGRKLYRHTANFEGEYLFRTLFEQKKEEPIVYPPIPHAVFSNPQVAGVGKTEEQLIEEGVDYIKAVNAYEDSAMGMALRSDHGFAKLLFDKRTQRLLGGHIVGEEASNMVHMLIAYMNMNACLEDLLRTIYIHPALPEVIRNAARKARLAFEECS